MARQVPAEYSKTYAVTLGYHTLWIRERLPLFPSEWSITWNRPNHHNIFIGTTLIDLWEDSRAIIHYATSIEDAKQKLDQLDAVLRQLMEDDSPLSDVKIRHPVPIHIHSVCTIGHLGYECGWLSQYIHEFPLDWRAVTSDKRVLIVHIGDVAYHVESNGRVSLILNWKDDVPLLDGAWAMVTNFIDDLKLNKAL